MTRINKYLSEIGFCSRREADKLIEQGRVHLNDKVVHSGDNYNEGDELTVDFENVIPKKKENPLYIAFNKPKRIVCTTDTKGEKDNIIDFIGHPQRIFPIGRLDKLSEGLILLTNDGDIVNKILRAENEHEKEYEVVVNKDITPSFIKRMSNGLPILGTKTKKCKLIPQGNDRFRIILTQGLNRQIRRMCEFLGYKVTALKRTRIMHIKLDVGVGQWRELTENELNELHAKISGSTKVAQSDQKATQRPPQKKGANKGGKLRIAIQMKENGKKESRSKSKNQSKKISAKHKRK